MEVAASLKQTLTHLFDAVRSADHASELEELARGVERDLETSMNKLEAHSEEISNPLASMRNDDEIVLKEFSNQIEEFLGTAKEQAKSKMQKKAKQELEDHQRAIASEKDKAMKSLEAYFASEPLPIVENAIQVRLKDEVYEARSRYECEGEMKYDFRLAAQNSRFFHQPFALSQVGYELRVPVRFSRGLLSKTRVPGFERLDQYILADAETSGGKLRANFEKPGNGGSIKLVTSGSQDDGFVGIEYSDQIQAVNVMNDPALVAFVDIPTIKKAVNELVTELTDLSKKKVALLRLALNGEQTTNELSCREILNRVLGVMGPTYRTLIKKMLSGGSPDDRKELDLEFVRGRLKVLDEDLSKSVSASLGL